MLNFAVLRLQIPSRLQQSVGMTDLTIQARKNDRQLHESVNCLETRKALTRGRTDHFNIFLLPVTLTLTLTCDLDLEWIKLNHLGQRSKVMFEVIARTRRRT